MDSHGRHVCAHGYTRTHTDSNGSPVCADGHTQTSSTDVLCVLTDTHGRHVCADENTHGLPVCTEQTAHVGQNHPNSPREGPVC
ncbi:unnamed protein product [Brassica rapa]|uniref:Uncharacterized protein n=1 Tax=Brassica campestris TaxID=3711 RepID=A0A8D9DHI2_BRACM|nr:unnamed protein product [Brassica rapa]